MRLLNLKTRQVELFFGDFIPPYAILSHRWGEHETSFQEIQSKKYLLTRRWPPKLEGTRKIAKVQGFNYIWVDTCCIDKTSSSELEEAINSMYQWYRNAAVCYAFLPDVAPGDIVSSEGSNFRNSSWFLRGWTLQELLAPTKLEFYNSNWDFIGTKDQLSLVIESVTRIPVAILVGAKDLQHCSVAQRMSWAANRVTTRKEDLAYCLLGVFGITMPMIYGEEERAFVRLQEEIMKHSSDQSILTGARVLPALKLSLSWDLVLAKYPSDFKDCGSIIQCSGLKEKDFDPFTDWLTNTTSESQTQTQTLAGELRLRIPFVELVDGGCFAMLNCRVEEKEDHLIVVIPLLWSGSDLQHISTTSPFVISETLSFGLIHRDTGESNRSKVSITCKKSTEAQVACTPARYRFESNVDSESLRLVEVLSSNMSPDESIGFVKSGATRELQPPEWSLLRFQNNRQEEDSELVVGVWALYLWNQTIVSCACIAMPLDEWKEFIEGFSTEVYNTESRSSGEETFGSLKLEVTSSREMHDGRETFIVRLNEQDSVVDSAVSEIQKQGITSTQNDENSSGGPPPAWLKLLLPFLATPFASAGSWIFFLLLIPLAIAKEVHSVILIQIFVWALHSLNSNDGGRMREVQRMSEPSYSYWADAFNFGMSLAVGLGAFIGFIAVISRTSRRSEISESPA